MNLPPCIIGLGDPSAMMASFDLDGTVSTLVRWLLLALIFGTLLAALTWLLVHTLLRRVGPAVHGALWVVVLLKFVVPIGPEWSWSLANGARAITDRVTPDAPAETPAPDANAGELTAAVFAFEPTDDSPALAAPPPAERPWSLLTVLGLAYLAATACVGAIRLWRYRRFASRCRTLPRADASVRNVVAEASRRIGVHRELDVRVSDEAPSPYIFGLARPTLVLAPRQIERPEELEAVVLHEAAHLRRGDLFVRYVQWVVGTALFFWPVVAWVNRRIDLAREHACDAWALRHGRLSAAEYARCLLRALHPPGAVRGTFRPAAMAASLVHVERRIEMILDSTPRTRRATLGLPAAALVAGWSLFVLTGAAAPPPAEEPAGQSGVEPQKQMVVTVRKVAEGDEQKQEVKVEVVQVGENGGPPVLSGELLKGASRQIVLHKTVDGAQRQIAVFVSTGPSEKELAEFGAAHPTADADGNGTVSRNEFYAYHVALALRDPAAVITKYAEADRNKDGGLSASEAAMLVSSGVFPRGKTAFASEPIVIAEDSGCDSDGTFNIKIEDEAADPDQPAAIHREVRQMVIRRGSGQPGEALAIAARVEPVTRWLLDNIQVVPAATEVAQYVSIVEQAPLAAFLEANPAADANGDGRLTIEERDAYLKAEMAEVHVKLLKSMPEADADGDGKLSEEELCNLHGKGAVWVEQTGDASGAQRKIIVRKLRDPAGGETEKVDVVIEKDDGSNP